MSLMFIDCTSLQAAGQRWPAHAARGGKVSCGNEESISGFETTAAVLAQDTCLKMREWRHDLHSHPELGFNDCILGKGAGLRLRLVERQLPA